MTLLRLAPALTLAVMIGPVAAGMAGTLLPALGLMPVLGQSGPGLGPIRDLLGWPGLTRSAGLSVWTGGAATAIALAITLTICAGWHGTRAFGWLERALSPLLSLPHAAAAFGLAFLIAPSGWIARLIAPLAGWDRPPDVLILQDPAGLSLIAGLVVKEVPFLLLMSLAAMPALRPAHSLTTARALGYGRMTGWAKAVLPRLYPQIRLPVYAVLAYSMSAVDVAMILGPGTPPPLPVQVLRWMNDPDLTLRLRACAGALLQLVLTLGALGLWRGAELAVARAAGWWLVCGGRGARDGAARAAALGLGALTAGGLIAGLALLAVWSVAGFWGFPALLPDAVTLEGWHRQGATLVAPTADTALIALAATGVALALTLACLEAETRYGLKPGTRALVLLYLPLILPQIAFLPGLQVLALQSGVDGTRGAVIAAHVVFVLPYVFLSLSDPWRGFDPRQAAVARALGASPTQVFWRVRLPMLLRPVLTAAAVGAAVSVGQFLPTLLLGAGRVTTLTTEAVALAAGGQRRIIGVTALAQTAAAFVPFALALAIPALVFRNRRGMRHG
ncbi:ABC transporter permease [Salipiger aestuarii]|uniref:Putative thiamine transport system permease protein n=1 Tax=Salipiger aestuarii TaxID=568098 RepID=A0A327YTL5_9RHOB|nr:ABC transporter permease subunit [Salipiger aestuarii]KAA8610158.1 ABC transporter permease [Salipiger aestuarii]KAB2543357.1 ABC transporter permease [Salipiger aestuarii]RAK23972.1 putative thiamine transport system permease protein [Salipiger aestuarii]